MSNHEVATIELSKEYAMSVGPVSALVMREPTVDDMIVASETKGSEAMQEIAQLANLCEITPADVRKLSLRDYKKLQSAWTGFVD